MPELSAGRASAILPRMTPSVERAGRMWLRERGMPLVTVAAVAARLAQVGPEASAAVAAAFGGAAAAEFTARLASGRRAYAAWSGNAMAALGWVSFRPEHIGEHGLWVNLQPGEAYVWDCVTLAEYRGRGLYRALVAQAAADLFAQGLERIWIGADLSNVPSQRGIAGAGFVPVVDLLAAPLGPGLKLLWLEALPGTSAAQAAAGKRLLFGERARAPRKQAASQRQPPSPSRT